MDIENEIKIIKERNLRVESDKTWEVSWTRKVFISVGTYIVAALWLYVIGNEDFLLNAVIPTGGYILSTLTLPFVKRRWVKKASDI